MRTRRYDRLQIDQYRDRKEAGASLAERLNLYRGAETLVLGIPRGGVPVALEIASRLDAEFDVVVARKVGAPFCEELAIGAVTANGGSYLDQELVRELDISSAYLEAALAREMAEARRRERLFRRGRSPVDVKARTVIVVDDGLATASTMIAAARAVQLGHPGKLIAAIPVASRFGCDALRKEVDEVVCPYIPESFYSVGMFYVQFEQVQSSDVIRMIEDFRKHQAELEEVGWGT